MSLEFGERSPTNIATIELCGTPFSARFKFLVHNAIEDMITERRGKKTRGAEGFSESFWGSILSDRGHASLEYFKQVGRVRKLLGEVRPEIEILLLQDGAFSAMVMTEVMRKAMVLSNQDTEDHLRGLLPFVRMEDFIVLTLVRPRAALTREIYPADLEGHDELMERRYIFFTVFNEAAEAVMKEFQTQLPKIEIIRVGGDNFQRDEIFFRNANLVFQFLGLPTIEEWSERLIQQSELAGRGVKSGGVTSTTAGLTVEELKDYLRRRDWSVDPEQRRRVSAMAFQIIGALKERGLI